MVSVTRLDLVAFRNYAQARLDVAGARAVTLVGPNGAGKTNILEALSCFSPGRGLRGAKLSDLGRRDSTEAWTVATRITDEDAGEERRLGVGLVRDPDGREKRVARLDGAPAGPADLGRAAPILWLTPQMDRLFTDPPASRRRFLDRLVFACRPEHARIAGDHEKALKERNRLLAEGGRDGRWLEAVERRLAETGVALTLARAETLDRLAPFLVHKGDDLDLPLAEARLDDASRALVAGPAADAEDARAAALRRARAVDMRAGRTLEGPHRADLLVRHAGKDMPADQCSTGEQKALLLGLIMAQARLVRHERGGPAPLLLLDEVAAHLDADRRAALYEALLGLGSQLWMTGADDALFAPLGAQGHKVRVQDGVLSTGN